MVLQHGKKLAIHLISAHFGDLVSKVCDVLMTKGTLALPDITRYSALPLQQVKNCLLVLIQHNCVQAFDLEKEAGFGVAPKVITHYTVIFENILHRMRFSKFLAVVSEDLGKDCEKLLEGLFQHGRLTLEQILLRAVGQSEGDATDQDAVRENFVKLVTAHYVERCPAPAPSIGQEEDEAPSARRGAKAAKLIQTKTVERQAIENAIPSESERFLVITDTGTDVLSGVAKPKAKSLKAIPGGKRKHMVLESDDDEVGDPTNFEKDVVWRANFSEFVCRLRNKYCIANVRSRLDDEAGIVLSAMLEATKGSVPLPINDIFEGVIKTEKGRSMTYDHVRSALEQLGFQPMTTGTEESYSVDLKYILEIAQNEEVESIVLKRYNRSTYSIFRLLSSTGCLTESDKISSSTLVDKKDALAILYKLWKDDYLQIQRVESQAKVPVLLWKVKKSSVKENIINDMYHSVLNLSQRIAFELERQYDILQLPKDKRVGAQGKRFERLRNVRILLESSLMKLDDVLMLFNDFSAV